MYKIGLRGTWSL